MQGKLLLLLFVIIFFASCSYTRYLTDEDKLYTGSDVEILSDEKLPDKKSRERSLENLIRESPNTKILWMRPRLWIYNVTGETRERGVRNWIKTRLGEPPVYFENIDVDRTALIMENRLQNAGFFDATVSYDVEVRRQKAKVKYTAHVNKPYIISNIFFPSGNTQLESEIQESKNQSLLNTGDSYDLSNLKKERERIEDNLRNKGYYFFNENHLIFRVDSTIGNRKVDIYFFLKDDIPDNAKIPYKISNLNIHSEYMYREVSNNITDTIMLCDSIYYFDSNKLFNPEIILSSVFLRPGELYRRSNHEQTLNHLMSLQNFKFANIRYTENNLNNSPSLDVSIYLTPMEQKSLSAEIKATTKSNNLTGPGLLTAYSNRNLFGGMENFSLRLDGSFETTLGRSYDPVSSTEIGVESELLVPRFLTPFGIKPHYSYTIPKTQMLLSVNYLNRTDMMNLFSVKAQYGYRWNSNIATYHRLSPVVFNFFILGTLASDFEALLDRQELYRRGLFDQYILGGEYSYTYNTQLLPDLVTNNWYFNINFDIAGNTTYLLFNQVIGGLRGERGTSEFGSNFSQYFKTDFDTHYFLRGVNPGNATALRLHAGIAVPYANSDYLPYNRRFTIGGVNSIRAFHPRSIGPGTYKPADTIQTGYSIYQSGEIKLLATIEQRFDMTKYLKGALFIDAGNVWNTQDYENTSGGKFESSRFLEQIALGAGFGIRIDVNFFVLRFDLAFPLAVPYNTTRYFEPVDPLSSSWRRNNLILNFAIGYPF